MGIFDTVKQSLKDAQDKAAAEAAAEAAANEAWQERYNKVVITTGDLKQSYDVIDTVFAMDSSEAGFFTGANPTEAFQGLNAQLRSAAATWEADAIVACQFEYRNALTQGAFGGTNQVIELFAYGTAVKFKD